MSRTAVVDNALRRGAAAYLDGALTTASPEQVVVLLYDRLALDLDRAEQALRAGLPAGTHLLHAQDVVMALLTSLDTSEWPAAPRLAGLYAFLHTRLVQANVHQDGHLVRSCRETVGPLRGAWRDALTSLVATGAGIASPGAGPAVAVSM